MNILLEANTTILNNPLVLGAIVLGAVVVLVALIVFFIKLPKIRANAKAKREAKAEKAAADALQRAKDMDYENAVFAKRAEAEKAEKKEFDERQAINSNSVVNILHKTEFSTTKEDLVKRNEERKEAEKAENVLNTLQGKSQETPKAEEKPVENNNENSSSVIGILNRDQFKK